MDVSPRVIAQAPVSEDGDADEMVLEVDDPFLRSPRVIGLDDGFASSVFGQRRTETGLVLPIEEPRPVTLLSLERMTAAEMEGSEEETRVESERRMPVEEILRRLQAGVFYDEGQDFPLPLAGVNYLDLDFLDVCPSPGGSVLASHT